MAELRFFFGTMGSGKSTQALQIHHNLVGRGLRCLLISQLDRQIGRVSSRLGVSAEATVIDPSVDLYRLLREEDLRGSEGLHAVICDEGQFYASHQVDQLARVVDELEIEVYAFGLLTTFQGLLFDGTKRFLELADVRSELQVEARCWCGRRATHNARLVNGRQVYDGEITVIGDTGPTDIGPVDSGSGDSALPTTVSYDLRCRRHWNAEKEHVAQDRLFEGDW